MTAIQLFNEVLFIVTFLVLIVTLVILSIVAILRYRNETHQINENAQRIERLEVRIDTCMSKKEEA